MFQNVINLNEVGVLETGQHLGFVLEALAVPGVVFATGTDRLERNQLLEPVRATPARQPNAATMLCYARYQAPLDHLLATGERLILTRHEQSAGFMAATYGRLTGRAGVCLATLGPGATNLVTAAAFAQLGAMPMVMITGQKPIKTSKQGRFQIVDTVDMMTPLTKFCEQIVAGDRIPSLVREAFRRAEEERPGAAHIELPEDIADAFGIKKS